MSDLNFPTSPTLNDTYSFNGKTWVWNGQGWQLQNQGAINGIIIGNSTPAAGTFTILSATGNITGNYFLGNGSQLSGIITTVDANTLTGNTLSSNIVNSSLTSTGILGSLSVTGNITGGNVNAAQLYSAGALTITNGSGNINITPAGNVVLNNNYLSGLQLNPQGNSDAATKYYVDNMVSTALSYHAAVTAATTTTLATTTSGTITYTQPNGAGNGVGATLATTGSFDLIDTANVQTVGTRILVKDEGNAVFNGVYTWSNATVITRSSDADTYAPSSPNALSINDYFFVSSGNVNAGSAWIVDSPLGTITFGTSNIAFAQFSQSQPYLAGNGININGTVITAQVDNNTTAFDGSGNIIVKASANLTTPNIGAATGTSLSVTGNITGGNVISGGTRAYKWTTQANTAPSNSVPGDNWYDSYADKLYLYVNDGTGNQWVDQSSPTTFDSLNVIGNTASGNLLTTGQVSAAGNITGNYFLGNGSLLTNITGANVTGTVANATYAASAGSATSATTAATVTTAAQANITSVGTLTSLSVTGTATLGNVNTGGTISATGNITGGNVLGGANVNATTHTGTTVSVTGNITGGNLLTGGLISATGNITGGNVLGGANVNATTHTGTTVSVTGNITGGNLLISGAIQDSAQLDIQTTAGNANIVLTPNGTGNVNISANIMPTANATANIGSATSSFNTVFAKATSAQYADLAEMYEADADYAPGTVLEFGGDKEVTISNTPFSPLVIGVVSTNPAYLMNSTAQGKYMAAIALVGRVPTQVIGPVSKGAMMVSAGNGHARSAAAPGMGTVIGKAVEDFTGESGVIEITIGRL